MGHRLLFTVDRNGIVSSHKSQVASQNLVFDLGHETYDLRPPLAVNAQGWAVDAAEVL